MVIANPDADERLVFSISAEFPTSTSTGEQRFLDWVANYENSNVWNGCEYWMTVERDQQEGTDRTLFIVDEGCWNGLRLGAKMKTSAFDSLRYLDESDVSLKCDEPDGDYTSCYFDLTANTRGGWQVSGGDSVAGWVANYL